MAVQRLDIHRRDRGERALVTLVGDIWPATTPLLRAAPEQCLRDGMTAIDVDLTTAHSCDAKGLDAFLTASRRPGVPASRRSGVPAFRPGARLPVPPPSVPARASGRRSRPGVAREIPGACRAHDHRSAVFGG
ncbi:anti-sigma factor antagonist [Streptomyces sp. NPDC059629]|uniref:anti-sigma factor antagonist n=1 Tax=Streptomyces sp. NPDC059629 TaxID=3346889 RepID=UPI00368AC9E7